MLCRAFVLSLLTTFPLLAVAEEETAWDNFAGHSQHTGLAGVQSQDTLRIRWSTPVDEQPQYNGTALLAHYGSPVVSSNSIVLLMVKTGVDDGFKVEARYAYDGGLVWTKKTDYSLPPHSWLPSVGPAILPEDPGAAEDEGGKAAYPGAGGTVYVQLAIADKKAPVEQRCFFGIDEYKLHQSTYDNTVKICTPLTSDDLGNLYFGFQVLGNNPNGLTSGIAKVSPDGTGTWISAEDAAQDPAAQRPLTNCAPALNNDQSVLYIGLTGGTNYLVGVSTKDLSPVSRVVPLDPKTHLPALTADEGTSSPMVAPDGDVYYGMFDNPFGYTHYRGYMLRFSADLVQKNYAGAFGWDSTASVVPAESVPSYHGSSQYLILTKYNNYYGIGGDGMNKVAILDPNDFQFDPIDQTETMKEVLTVLGPTQDPNGGVREWCINTVAVDPFRKLALVNSEDGKCYQWDFTTNTLFNTVTLTEGIGEAYTPTVIGPDGTGFAMNNATLFALGDNTLLSDFYTVTHGVVGEGLTSATYYDDDESLELLSGLSPLYDRVAQIVMDTTGFKMFGANGSFVFSIKSRSKDPGFGQQVEMYNYRTGQFESIDQAGIGTLDGWRTVSVANDAARFMDPDTLKMRVRLSYFAIRPQPTLKFATYVNVVKWVVNP